MVMGRNECGSNAMVTVQMTVEEYLEMKSRQDGTTDGTKAFEAILSHISNDPRVTIDELVTLTGISRRQVLRYVKELTEDEVIRRDGGRKLGKWVILKEYSTKDSE